MAGGAGGFIGGYDPLAQTPPSRSGVWGLVEQLQAVADGEWSGQPAYNLYTWGAYSSGRLGFSGLVNKSSPTQVGALSNWANISSGPACNAASKQDNTLWTWGSNIYGQLGNNSTSNTSSPIQVGSLADWSSFDIAYHCLAVRTNGTLWAWGRNETGGALGNGTVVNVSSPIQIGALTNWSKVSAGVFNSHAIKTNGTLWSWGANGDGRL